MKARKKKRVGRKNEHRWNKSDWGTAPKSPRLRDHGLGVAPLRRNGRTLVEISGQDELTGGRDTLILPTLCSRKGSSSTFHYSWLQGKTLMAMLL